MDGSRNPGKDSLPYPKNHTEVAAAVARRAASAEIIQVQKALGRDADLHLVGGVLRDIAEGLPPGDLDLATRLRPQQVVERLEGAGVRVVPTGLQHGTVLAVVNDCHLELTTFRKPGAEFGAAIEEDLSGRDFTINALAYSLDSGSLIDLHGSIEDIRARCLRAVGNATQRFQEDPLRILRAIRFGPAARRIFAGEIAEGIADVRARLSGVSPERVRLELERILLALEPAAGVRALAEHDLLQYVIPEAIPSLGCEQNKFHTQDVFEHTLTVISRARRDLTLRLVALFHDLGKPHTVSVDEDGDRHFYKHEEVSDQLAQQAMERLRFSNEMTERVRKLVRMHMRPVDCGPAGVRRLLRDLGDDFATWREFKFADSPPVMSDEELAQRMQSFDRMVADEHARRLAAGGSRLAIRGQDLVDGGMKEGPDIGRILKILEEMVIETPELNTREALLARIPELKAKLTL